MLCDYKHEYHPAPGKPGFKTQNIHPSHKHTRTFSLTSLDI